MKEAAALLDARLRRRARRVLVEGPKAIADALASGARFERAFAREGGAGAEAARAAEALGRADVPVLEAAAAAFDAICATETSQGLVAVALEPSWDATALLEGPEEAPLVVLDRVQDPGNAGAILRTAAALGFGGAVLVEGTADPFAVKVVRAAAATVFRLPIVAFPEGGLSHRHAVVAAAAPGEAPAAAMRAALDRAARRVAAARADLARVKEAACVMTSDARLALVLGNEGRGVSEALLARADARAWIPLANEVESLNVAAAFAILAWEARRLPAAPPAP